MGISNAIRHFHVTFQRPLRCGRTGRILVLHISRSLPFAVFQKSLCMVWRRSFFHKLINETAICAAGAQMAIIAEQNLTFGLRFL